MTNAPDLICIGAHKAGTTWLYHALKNTPGVFTPLIKELHYFSELHCPQVQTYSTTHREYQYASVRNYLTTQDQQAPQTQLANAQLNHLETSPIDDDWYQGIFAFATENQIRAEVCPSYMLLPTIGIEHILNINPLVNILFFVRDPIDRAWSNIRSWLNRGLIDKDVSKLFDNHDMLKVLIEHTSYSRIIPRWESALAAEHFKIMLYDKLQSHPRDFLDDIQTYIGCDPRSPTIDLTARVHQGPPMQIAPETRSALLDLLTPEYDFLSSRYPDQVTNWLKTHKQALAKT